MHLCNQNYAMKADEKSNLICRERCKHSLSITSHTAPNGGKNQYDFFHLWKKKTLLPFWLVMQYFERVRKIVRPMGLLLIKEKRFWICEFALSKSRYFFYTKDYAMQICIILQPPSTWQEWMFSLQEYSRYSCYELGLFVLAGPSSFCIYFSSTVNHNVPPDSKDLPEQTGWRKYVSLKRD